MAPPTKEIVNRLWALCHVLRDDGVSYQQYVTELTYLLFLKMLAETGGEVEVPAGHRWQNLVAANGVAQLKLYKQILTVLGEERVGRVQAIYVNAQTAIQQPRVLAKLVTDIDGLDWFSAQQEGLGDLYEGLLEKNATESKRGAGQYFTPRPLIDAIIDVLKPQPGEVIQDPAAGTAGFLVAADRYIKRHTDDLFDLAQDGQEFQRTSALQGMELVPATHRLALMNAMLHGFDGVIKQGDTLSSVGSDLPKADLIVTNPPFGTKTGGGRPTRVDFTFPTGNKQLAFLQHVYRGLKVGGRAGVVLPDNVLFEEGVGQLIRRDLMDKCDLHTILRLPTGIFYAPGVKTNVLFFTRGATDRGNTKTTWVFDLRSDMPNLGKRTPFTRAMLDSFTAAYGDDPNGRSARSTSAGNPRWRSFSRRYVSDRDDDLNISWLDGSSDDSARRSPDVILAEISSLLQDAEEAVRAVAALVATERVSQ